MQLLTPDGVGPFPVILFLQGIELVGLYDTQSVGLDPVLVEGGPVAAGYGKNTEVVQHLFLFRIGIRGVKYNTPTKDYTFNHSKDITYYSYKNITYQHVNPQLLPNQ